MFNKYRIPRESLLNRNGDVTPEGKYVSPLRVRCFSSLICYCFVFENAMIMLYMYV